MVEDTSTVKETEAVGGAKDPKRGIVYIMTNISMPDLIKIGKTGGDSPKDVEDRMRSLDSTGVPTQFSCYYAAVVSDNAWIEKQLHVIFERDRIRPTREFLHRPFSVQRLLWSWWRSATYPPARLHLSWLKQGT